MKNLSQKKSSNMRVLAKRFCLFESERERENFWLWRGQSEWERLYRIRYSFSPTYITNFVLFIRLFKRILFSLYKRERELRAAVEVAFKQQKINILNDDFFDWKNFLKNCIILFVFCFQVSINHHRVDESGVKINKLKMKNNQNINLRLVARYILY